MISDIERLRESQFKLYGMELAKPTLFTLEDYDEKNLGNHLGVCFSLCL